MGDRVSIQLQQDQEKSVVLFSHWGGMPFVKWAKREVPRIILQAEGLINGPVSRGEPNSVMVELAYRARRRIKPDDDPITGDLYFGVNENDGDNSDNGHYIIRIPYANQTL